MKEIFSESELRACAKNLGLEDLAFKNRVNNRGSDRVRINQKQEEIPLKKVQSIYSCESLNDRRLLREAMTHGVIFGPDDPPTARLTNG